MGERPRFAAIRVGDDWLVTDSEATEHPMFNFGREMIDAENVATQLNEMAEEARRCREKAGHQEPSLRERLDKLTSEVDSNEAVRILADFLYEEGNLGPALDYAEREMRCR